MGIFAAPFDPERDFKAMTFFRFAGVIYEKHSTFDKAVANDRQLRQLYEARRIGYADVTYVKKHDGLNAGGPSAGTPVAFRDPNMSNSEQDQIASLVDAHSHEKLWDMAKDLPDIKKSDNKTVLASAIVKAGNGAP